MTRHILILGGHGKIAQLLTPLLLQKSWTVTSIIRTPEQIPAIEGLATGHGKLNVLVRSLEDIREVSQAKGILDEVRPDSIVWTAGAGGKGPVERTFAVDRDAAACFVRAAVDTPSISKLVLISYLACRRASPSWWDADSWEYVRKVHASSLADYCEAKLQADQVLVQEASKRSDFAAISLRPGMLTDASSGGVELGKTKSAQGNISRASVAETVSALLENEALGTCWLDLLNGEEDVGTAVDLVAQGRVDAADGEKAHA